jgi:hypothetical protein
MPRPACCEEVGKIEEVGRRGRTSTAMGLRVVVVRGLAESEGVL